jgi:hypothetical protein
MLLNTDLNKAYCKCSNCGQVAEVDTSICLTSNPPKYNYHCPHCDNYNYILCSEVFYDYDTKPTKPQELSQGLHSYFSKYTKKSGFFILTFSFPDLSSKILF